jgi:hypothetical protein
VIFHDGLCSDISSIHATDDFMCREVDCEALVEGSAAHYFQHVKGALLVSNTRAPFYRAIEKYFEEIIVGVHGPSCQSADRADFKIVRTAETWLFNFEHMEVWQGSEKPLIEQGAQDGVMRCGTVPCSSVWYTRASR